MPLLSAALLLGGISVFLAIRWVRAARLPNERPVALVQSLAVSLAAGVLVAAALSNAGGLGGRLGILLTLLPPPPRCGLGRAPRR